MWSVVVHGIAAGAAVDLRPAWLTNAFNPCPRSYLGVSVLRSKPAIIMKYYERGSLAGEISQGYRHGMPEQQALRWGGTAGSLPAWADACYLLLPNYLRIPGACSPAALQQQQATTCMRATAAGLLLSTACGRCC